MSSLSPSLSLQHLSNRAIARLDRLPEERRHSRTNMAAKWCVPMNGKVYRIELEHGTTSGRRMIWVNGREVLRRDWMFKLVGEDTFYIDEARCVVRVDPAPGFKYDYLLFIEGKSYDQYTEQQAKAFRLWVTQLMGAECRVVLELDTLTISVNDRPRQESAVFVDGGTDTRFTERGCEFVLEARSSGNKRDGIVHTLRVNGRVVPEAKLHEIMHETTSIASEKMD